LAGIFGKAAMGFETEMRSYVSLLLKAIGLDYERKVRHQIKGPSFSKLTLGQFDRCGRDGVTTFASCCRFLRPLGVWSATTSRRHR